MSVVVDASVVTVLASGDPRKATAERLVTGWIDAGEPLHAPSLVPYEVASALARLVGAGLFPADRVSEAWQIVMGLPISFHQVHMGGERIVEIALQLRRRSAYDAAYLALAEQLSAELWTFDGPLTRNASLLGFRVRLVQ